VATYAARAGWRGADLVTSVAVALAETGGDPDRPGGLWNVPGSAGGDPAGNAAAAFARWQAAGWPAWNTYNSRRYVLFMPAAAAAVAASSVQSIVVDPPPVLTGGALGGLREAAGNLPGADVLDTARTGLGLAVKAGAWMANPDNWVRVVLVAVGSALLVGALVVLVRPAVAPVVEPAVRAARTVITKGK